jgi:hypothetical protein
VNCTEVTTAPLPAPQPAVEATVKVTPLELLVEFRVTPTDPDTVGVTLSPPPGEVTLTVIVLGLTRAVPALTVIVALVPGPFWILQVTDPEETVAVSELVACSAPAPAVSVSSAMNALALRYFDTDKSMQDLPFPLGFFSTTREEAIDDVSLLTHIGHASDDFPLKVMIR